MRVSIWVTIGSVIAAFVAGFSFANYLNRSQMTGIQSPATNVIPSTNQQSSQQATLTDEEIEASIDYEQEGHFDLNKGRMIYTPEAKRQITLRLDPDVIDFFKAGGPGYQTRMNAVLRQYVVANAK